MRYTDGSAGDADYGRIGVGYTKYRRPDPRISAAILDARRLSSPRNTSRYPETSSCRSSSSSACKWRSTSRENLSQQGFATFTATPNGTLYSPKRSTYKRGSESSPSASKPSLSAAVLRSSIESNILSLTLTPKPDLCAGFLRYGGIDGFDRPVHRGAVDVVRGLHHGEHPPFVLKQRLLLVPAGGEPDLQDPLLQALVFSAERAHLGLQLAR